MPPSTPLLRVLAFLLFAPIVQGRQFLQQSGEKHVASDAVRKPLTDHRSYEHVVFAANGLKVLAVQDERAAKAGFAVAVEAGSFYDPEQFPGLAHFCEHLLFLGTKKYPDEASFDEFMSLHDGSNNAFTEQERTVFYNEVGHSGFDEGLDRFAQFFIAPLFKQEMVGRELNAVNSEHEKNKPDQGRRLWEILRGTAREDSVISRFYTGTVESLHHGDAGAVAALRRYHDANYCAPRMNLVMISNLSTAEQLRIAHEHFDAVPRGSCSPTRDFGREQALGQQPPPFDNKHLGQYIRMGTNSTPALWIMFPLEPTMKNYKEAPLQYLEYMLGYAGPGSLRSQLKRRGLINGVELQADESSAATVFFMMFDLTPAGAEEDGVREVAGSTFAFLRLLNAELEGQVSSVYGSLQRMSQVSFDYFEAPDSVMDAVSDLAAAMSRFPPEDVLSGSFGLVDRPDPALARSLLALLSRAQGGASIALAAPRVLDTGANGFEKYYGIHYHKGPIPAEWVRQWDMDGLRGASDLRPPPPLKYVPSALAVRSATAGPHPVRLEIKPPAGQHSDGASMEVWWKGQGAFKLPKAQLRMKLTVPRAQSVDVEHEVVRRLHAELVRQVLEESTEDLQNCGLNFQVAAAGDGFRLEVDGYDQHLDVLLLRSLDGLLEPQFGAAELERARQQVVDDLADTTRKAPYELALDAISALTTDNVFGREDMLSELGRVDEPRLRRHLAMLRSDGLRVQLLLVGNMDRQPSQDLAARVQERITRRTARAGAAAASQAHAGAAGRILTAGEAQSPRVLVAARPVEVRMRNPIPGDLNHATVSSYQYGVPDVSERVQMMLLGKMLENPVYDTLRTKKQLGYIVFGFVTEQVGVLELRVLVQGAKETPDQVDGDIEAVIDEFGGRLRNMTDTEFLKWKGSIRSALHHKDQNMGQEADRYWGQIANDGRCFDRKELALQYLESLQNAEDTMKTFEKLRRAHRKVSVKMFGLGTDPGVLKAQAPALAEAAGGVAAPLVLLGASSEEKTRLLQEEGVAPYYPAETICRISK